MKNGIKGDTSVTLDDKVLDLYSTGDVYVTEGDISFFLFLPIIITFVTGDF